MGVMKIKTYLEILLVTFIFFTLSLLKYTNDICCMYSSIRAYGFPGQYLFLTKNTDSWQEAQKVAYLTTKELLKQGWELKFGTYTGSPVSHSPILNLIINFSTSLIISLSIFIIVKKIKKG